jgi:NADPH:quinone reductase-like Zn-dependent oxidoreductase
VKKDIQMKAIVYTKYGPPDVLQLREVAKPVPKDNQVLVKVQAASANALDFRRFTSTSMVGRFMDGVLLKAINTVLGADIAGRGYSDSRWWIIRTFLPLA